MTDSRDSRMLTLEERYTSTPLGKRFEWEVAQSLNPRSGDMLLDMVAALGLDQESTILDAGCGTGYYAVQLAERFPDRILAIDVVPSLLAVSREKVTAAGLEDRVTVQAASILDIPVAAESFDLVWCRDMLGDGFPIPPAVRECSRVLRPGGAMVVYKTFAGDLLEPREAERLYRALGGGTLEQERTAHAEQAFADAGLHIVTKEVIASEWREDEVEQGERRALDGLLYAARLLRRRRSFVERYGEGRYEQALADAQWFPFIMLGKLLPVAYLLRKDADPSR